MENHKVRSSIIEHIVLVLELCYFYKKFIKETKIPKSRYDFNKK
jgi:hypothetical protein